MWMIQFLTYIGSCCNDLELAQSCRVWCLSHIFFIVILICTCQRELLQKNLSLGITKPTC